jgi:hypothetical protein
VEVVGDHLRVKRWRNRELACGIGEGDGRFVAVSVIKLNYTVPLAPVQTTAAQLRKKHRGEAAPPADKRREKWTMKRSQSFLNRKTVTTSRSSSRMRL